MSNTQAANNLTHDGPIDSSLKDYLAAKGIRPATWRLLCRTGTAWTHEFLVYYRYRSKRHIHPTVLVDLVTIAQAFGSQRLVPAWMLHAFLQLGGNPNAPSAGYTLRLDDLFPVCRRLGVLWVRANAEDVAVLQDRAVEIFRWATTQACYIAPGTLRKASVQWFVHQVDLLALKERLQLQGAAGWNIPYHLERTFTLETSPGGTVSAVILSTPLAVWEDGQVMRHCARTYIDRCTRGRVLLVSLRGSAKQTPLATVAYDLTDPQLPIKAISGFANRLVDREICDVAKAYQVDLQIQHTTLGLVTATSTLSTPEEIA